MAEISGADQTAAVESPQLGERHERFLQLIACAGARDRFRALDIRRAQGIEAALAFIGGSEITQEGATDNPLPANRRSGASAFDDLTLTLERAVTLVDAIYDVELHGENRNIGSLISMAKFEIEYAEQIALANAKWNDA